MTPLRVAVLLESYVPVVGGMEAQARNLGAALKAEGVELFFITRRPDPALSRDEVIDGIPVTRLGPVGPSSRLRWPMVLTALPELRRRRNEYDLIFVPGFRAVGLSAVWAGRWFKKAVVLKAESSGELSGAFFAGGFEKSKIGPKSKLASLLVALRNRTLLKADAFVGLSSEQAEEFQAAGVPPDRIKVIPQCLDEAIFTPPSAAEKQALREKLNLPLNETLIVYTGRLVSYKGLPSLLKAWKRICADRADGHLILVGAGGVDIYNCEAELRRYVADRNLSNRVTFTGAVSNVPEYLKAADIYAFPTENEAFGLALIEAMGCGLAIASTTTGGIKDFLEPEQNGVVIEAGDIDSMIAQLQRLLNDPALRAMLGAGARDTVVRRFTMKAVVQEYINLFGKLVSR